MLRNFENIWSKSLVNSEEFTMFAVPNNQISGKSCIDFLKHRNIAGFLDCIFLRRYGCLATQDRGSASSFIEKLLIKFLVSQMPNNTKDLKPRDNSTLTSTQPSEKGKSQSKLEKDKKSFGYSRNVRMFAVFKTKRTNLQTEEVFFIPEHFLSKNKTVGLPVASSLLCDDVRLVTNGRLDSLSLFNSFKFINK